MASNTGRSDQLSAAEQGQSQNRPSVDENSGLLSGQPRRLSQSNSQPNNNNNSNNSNKRPASTKRSFLSGNGRKKIIVSLTAISGGLLVILAFALFKKIGTDPSKFF
jgi:gamma-glutamyltranspeptidase/glutathione hydrolase/leukotriene-C4 hydrolase